MPPLKFSVQGLQQAVAAQERIRRGLKEQGLEVEKVTRSTSELGRITKKVQNDTETAQQRLIRLLNESKSAQDFGTLSAEAFRKKQVQLQQQYEINTGEFKKFGNESEKAFGGAGLSRLKTFVLGVASIGTAVRLVTDEIRAQQELIDRSVSQSLSLVQARNVLNRNVAGVTPAERLSTQQQFTAISDEFFIDRSIGTRAAAEALSAVGGVRNLDQALSATRFSSQLDQTNPEAIPTSAGAIADVMQLLETTDASRAAGLISEIGIAGRVSDPTALARVLPRSIAQSLEAGSTPGGAGAILATLTGVGKDPRGRRAATQGPAFAEQLSEFDFGVGDAETALDVAANAVPDPYTRAGAQGFLTTTQISAVGTAQANLNARLAFKAESGTGREGLTTQQRIELLQANPEIAAEFLAGGSFGQFGSTFKSLLLRPEGLVARTHRANIAAIPTTPEGQRAAGQAALAGQLIDPLRGAAVVEQGIAGQFTGAITDQPSQFLSRAGRENIRGIAQHFGQSFLGAKIDDLIAALGGGVTPSEALGNLRQLSVNLGDLRQSGRTLGPVGAERQRLGAERSAELDRLIAPLEKLLDEAKDQTQAIRELEGLTVGAS